MLPTWLIEMRSVAVDAGLLASWQQGGRCLGCRRRSTTRTLFGLVPSKIEICPALMDG